jgi:hypothetical protein
VHITSRGGTDLRFRAGDRPANLQDGDASAGARGAGQVLIDKEIELPAGAFASRRSRTRSKASIAFPPSQWDGAPVEDSKLRFRRGASSRSPRRSGKEAVEPRCARPATPARVPRDRAGIQPAARRARARAVDSLLRLRRRRRPAVARRQHGAWRRGRRPAAYVRWNFFTDLTVTVGDTDWVRNGKTAN